jgi:hypothetical protein
MLPTCCTLCGSVTDAHEHSLTMQTQSMKRFDTILGEFCIHQNTTICRYSFPVYKLAGYTERCQPNLMSPSHGRRHDF